MSYSHDDDDRPVGLMSMLETRPSMVSHLPNRRALTVLAEMYAYYDPQPMTVLSRSAYDDAA